MKVNAYTEAFLQMIREKMDRDRGVGSILPGCIRLYEATGNQQFRSVLLTEMNRSITEDGKLADPSSSCYTDCLRYGHALFFALHETGEGKYKKAIDSFEKYIEEIHSGWTAEPYGALASALSLLDVISVSMPLRMAYEKEFNTYGRLGDITFCFQRTREQLFNPEKKLYSSDVNGDFLLPAIGRFLAALSDCIELCEEQLYEHYRCLIDLLREAVKGVLPYRDEKTGLFRLRIDEPEEAANPLQTEGSALIAYAILKGVRLGALNETYREYGHAIFDGLTLEHADEECTNALMLVTAEEIMSGRKP